MYQNAYFTFQKKCFHNTFCKFDVIQFDFG